MGLRLDVVTGSERLAKQIRNSEQARIPLMAVVGEREMESGTLAIRSRKGRGAPRACGPFERMCRCIASL